MSNTIHVCSGVCAGGGVQVYKARNSIEIQALCLIQYTSLQVSVLAVGYKCKQVFLQIENEPGYLQLLKYVQDVLKETSQSRGDSDGGTQSIEHQRDVAFNVSPMTCL